MHCIALLHVAVAQRSSSSALLDNVSMHQRRIICIPLVQPNRTSASVCQQDTVTACQKHARPDPDSLSNDSSL